MIVYALRNSDKEYISMSMGVTKNWFEASKFPESEIEKRIRYIDSQFKLVKFILNEVGEFCC